MAAVLKKRALAEFNSGVMIIKEEPGLVKPTKRLRFVKRTLTGSSIAGYAGLLDRCRTSNEALTLLLRISDALADDGEGSTPQQEDLNDTLRRLSEHFGNEKETCVRGKILCLMGDIGSLPYQDVQAIIDEMVGLMKREESHEVIGLGLSALLKLGLLLAKSSPVHLRLISLSKQYLCDTSQTIKCQSLELISKLLPTDGVKDLGPNTVRHVVSYTHFQDPRVRSAAFRAMLVLHERGIRIEVRSYCEICDALKDDYEIVREVAMELICKFAKDYPDHILTLPGSGEQQIRLADDAFGKICSGLTDLSLRVRAKAAELLGQLGGGIVGAKFLQQTLDKKLMSNMRKKRSAHERQREIVTAGEWSSGKKWADDAPREFVDAEAVSLISSGACGAFVHGLEDEFMEVRSASVDSLCTLALSDAHFASMSLDFLVDMFNDEIEGVRLKAIDSLTRISRSIIIREDQLETILGALEDFSIDVREALHKMLGASHLSTKDCLQMCMDSLMENLKKYPEDKKSVWHCVQKLGASHPTLVLPLVPCLLSIHPFLDMNEPDVEDPTYISVLIMVFNAANKCPNMLQLFEEHTMKHYSYLRDTMPTLVPHLKLNGGEGGSRRTSQELSAAVTHTEQFVERLLDKLENAHNPKLRGELLTSANQALAGLADMDENLSGLAHFSSRMIKCHLLLNKLMTNKLWLTPSALSSNDGTVIKSHITEILQMCFRLQYLFVGHSETVICAVKQLKLRALALQLVYTVHGSNLSALALSEHFLAEVDDLQRYFSIHALPLENFTAAVFRDFSIVEEPKPGVVARILLPLLALSPGPLPKPPNNIRMCTANILEPRGEADSALSFTAGLILGVPLDAELFNLPSSAPIRVKVKYPDQTTQLLMPCRSDLRISDLEATDSQDYHNYRLRTTVFLSHGVWTEACQVDLTLSLDLTASETSLGRRGEDNLCILDLCKPVTISISPKAVKRGI